VTLKVQSFHKQYLYFKFGDETRYENYNPPSCLMKSPCDMRLKPEYYHTTALKIWLITSMNFNICGALAAGR